MDEKERERKLSELASLVSSWEQSMRYNRLAAYGPDGAYRPVPKQLAFHAAGALFRHRCFMAGNQLGKTATASYEIAMHLTGLYPEWWTGKRFEGPVKFWAAGVTSETTRDAVQTKLLGDPGDWGSGTIPQTALLGDPQMARGLPGAVDFVYVRHVPTGQTSTLWFKSYERGREKWQAATLNGIWYDEEPPEDIYTEGLTRLNALQGISLLTFTPLLGLTSVVKLYLEPEQADAAAAERVLIRMDLSEASFYTPGQRASIEAQYTPIERLARVQGLPIIGSGLVYPILDGQIVIDPIPLKSHWRRICGLDLGIGHPTAVVWLAYDDERDVVYAYDCYKETSPTFSTHVDKIKARGDWIPVAWPHDGMKREPKSGETFAHMYSVLGLNMLDVSARYEDEAGGAQSAEPIVADILERMKAGRFRVFSSLIPWFKEKATHHRQDGHIVPTGDDLMAATRYAMMMLRYSIPAKRPIMPVTIPDYDPLTI